MRLEPHHIPCAASAEELVFLDACLRASPISSRRQQPCTPGKCRSARVVELHLAWDRLSNKRALTIECNGVGLDCEARKTAPTPSLMKLFKVLSKG